MGDLFSSCLELLVAPWLRIAVSRDELTAFQWCTCLLYAQGELGFGTSEAYDKVIVR